jgi:hypothetical protein
MTMTMTMATSSVVHVDLGTWQAVVVAAALVAVV